MVAIIGARRAVGRRRFNPKSLFKSGAQGLWLNPSDLTTTFQEDIASTPAGVGDPVGMIKDKSGNGNHAWQSVTARSPTLRQTASGRYYLELDGVDDFMRGVINGPTMARQDFTIAAAFRRVASAGAWQQVFYMADVSNTGLGGNGVPHLVRRDTTTQLGMHNAWVNDVGAFIDQGVNALDKDWVASTSRSNSGTTGSGGTLRVRGLMPGSAELVSTFTQTWASDPSTSFMVGAQDNDFSTTKPWAGRIYELVVVNKSLNEKDYIRLRNYLMRGLGS